MGKNLHTLATLKHQRKKTRRKENETDLDSYLKNMKANGADIARLEEDVRQLQAVRAEMIQLYPAYDMKRAKNRIDGAIKQVLARIAKLKIQKARRIAHPNPDFRG